MDSESYKNVKRGKPAFKGGIYNAKPIEVCRDSSGKLVPTEAEAQRFIADFTKTVRDAVRFAEKGAARE